MQNLATPSTASMNSILYATVEFCMEVVLVEAEIFEAPCFYFGPHVHAVLLSEVVAVMHDVETVYMLHDHVCLTVRLSEAEEY